MLPRTTATRREHTRRAGRAVNHRAVKVYHSGRSPNRMDAARVKALVRGQGGAVVLSLAPHLAEAVARGPHRHGPCPLCGGRDRFRPFHDFEASGAVYCNVCGRHLGDFLAVLQWANGWTFGQALEAAASWLGLAPGSPGAPRRCLPDPPLATTRPANEPDFRKAEAVRRTWEESRPISADDPVDTYLKSRGLDFLARWPAALRFHPGLPYFEEGQALGLFPAMVARVDAPDGRMVSVHRTYLRRNGSCKAPVPSPKKLMPPATPGATRGGAVRLFEPGEALALAEGIETALAVHELTGVPVWATVSAGGMRLVELPPVVRVVTVAADHDENGTGQEAARDLARRLLLAGIRVKLAIPPESGTDWLDVYAREGKR